MTNPASPDGPLDPGAVPLAIRHLIPHAEQWGIGDDVIRSMTVEAASDDALRGLVETVAAAPDELWSWLIGPESRTATPSREYVALTDLTQAADLARVILQQRSTSL